MSGNRRLRSIDLVLDGRSDAAIRADWAALESADLPNLSRHAGPSNRPHVTVAVGPDLEDSSDLRAALDVLPLPIGFGSLVVFGTPPRGLVLARLVGVSRELLDLHDAVRAVSPSALEVSPPRRWTPHVTLATRITPEQLAQAIPLLATNLEAAVVGATLWDPETQTVVDLRSG